MFMFSSFIIKKKNFKNTNNAIKMKIYLKYEGISFLNKGDI